MALHLESRYTVPQLEAKSNFPIIPYNDYLSLLQRKGVNFLVPELSQAQILMVEPDKDNLSLEHYLLHNVAGFNFPCAAAPDVRTAASYLNQAPHIHTLITELDPQPQQNVTFLQKTMFSGSKVKLDAPHLIIVTTRASMLNGSDTRTKNLPFLIQLKQLALASKISILHKPFENTDLIDTFHKALSPQVAV